MSSSLDKSLDDIISSNKKTFKSKDQVLNLALKVATVLVRKIGGTNVTKTNSQI